jgi:hypothetical protein
MSRFRHWKWLLEGQGWGWGLWNYRISSPGIYSSIKYSTTACSIKKFPLINLYFYRSCNFPSSWTTSKLFLEYSFLESFKHVSTMYFCSPKSYLFTLHSTDPKSVKNDCITFVISTTFTSFSQSVTSITVLIKHDSVAPILILSSTVILQTSDP